MLPSSFVPVRRVIITIQIPNRFVVICHEQILQPTIADIATEFKCHLQKVLILLDMQLITCHYKTTIRLEKKKVKLFNTINDLLKKSFFFRANGEH